MVGTTNSPNKREFSQQASKLDGWQAISIAEDGWEVGWEDLWMKAQLAQIGVANSKKMCAKR